MCRAVTIYLVLSVGAATAAEPTKADPPPHETDVFTSGTQGYHTYRIPSLLVTPKGTVLAFCEGRKTSRADHGDIDMLLRRSRDGGRTWGPMRLVHEEGGTANITIGNPCPVVDRDTGTIWLAMTRTNGRVLLTRSDDDAQTWAEPVDLTDQVKKPEWGWYAMGPGVGIQLRHGQHDGRLVIPANHRDTPDRSGPSSSHVIYSDDHGRTWQLGGSVGPHTNECQVVECSDGSLLINSRNHWGRSGARPDLAGRRVIARSTDGGQTWSEPQFDDALIEPQCQASLIRYSWPDHGDRSRLLFSNPASKSGRKRMTVRLSHDEGKTWPLSRVIYEGPAAYSCLAALPDGQIGLLYERDDYGKISFASFTLAWLTGS